MDFLKQQGRGCMYQSVDPYWPRDPCDTLTVRMNDERSVLLLCTAAVRLRRIYIRWENSVAELEIVQLDGLHRSFSCFVSWQCYRIRNWRAFSVNCFVFFVAFFHCRVCNTTNATRIPFLITKLTLNGRTTPSVSPVGILWEITKIPASFGRDVQRNHLFL